MHSLHNYFCELFVGVIEPREIYGQGTGFWDCILGSTVQLRIMWLKGILIHDAGNLISQSGSIIKVSEMQVGSQLDLKLYVART